MLPGSLVLLFLLAGSVPAQPAFVRQYCAGCHSGGQPAGSLSLAPLDAAHPEQKPAAWEKVIVKLRAGMMPPAGSPRPSKAATSTFLATLEDRLDRAAATSPNPGRPALHRLNRTEYANSVQDLLGVSVQGEALLPPDDMSHGFDNMAEVLNISPNLIEAYVRAAGKVSRAALGDAKMLPVVDTYHLRSTFSQTSHVEGTPPWSRGGMVIQHNFPADGEYALRMTLYFTTNTFLFGIHAKDEQLEVTLDNQRIALLKIDPLMKTDQDLRTDRFRVTAGPHTLSVAFLKRAAGPVDDFVQPFEHSLGDLFLGRTAGLSGLPHLRDVGIQGPWNITGVSDTPARNRILTCRPRAASDEVACAKQILTPLARQAYRRPVTDADIEPILSTWQNGRNRGGFEEGIRTALQFLLSNPQFIFRIERTPSSAAPGGSYRISNIELASRLSYFLWSSGPDDRLLRTAADGKLGDQAVLEQEVRRMLKDPRAEALVRNFAGQWLHLRNLEDAQPDLFDFPNANQNLLTSMRRETELLFATILREDRSVLDLVNADYTFVDEVLARHYRIPDVAGSEFRRIPVTDENRRGILGHASILTVTSFANRTSPVVRGKWVLDTLLGAPPPAPPANVPPLAENTDDSKPRSVRDRLEQHRKNPACASCHAVMDPVGFALENFDAVGAWRTRDNGFAVDASGKLVDGTLVDSPASLRRAIVARSDAYLLNFTERLLTYALGRGSEYYDKPAIRRVVRDATRDNNRLSSIILGIVRSVPFQQRRAEDRRS